MTTTDIDELYEIVKLQTEAIKMLKDELQNIKYFAIGLAIIMILSEIL